MVAAGFIAALGAFDVAAFNTALPVIGAEFNEAPAIAQWVLLGYLLPITAFAMPAGRWLDEVGRNRAVVLLLAGFGTSSVVGGLASSFGLLVVARGIQGLFGAGIFAVISVVAFESVPHSRAMAIAVLSMLAPVGGIFGPAVGGFLTETVGWRWIFAIHVLVVLCVGPVFASCMGQEKPLRWPRVELLGEVGTLGGAVTLLLLGLTWAPAYGAGWLTLCPAAVPLLLLWRRTHRTAPLVRLVRINGMTGSLVALALIGASVMGSQFLITYLAQDALGLSAGQAGIAILLIACLTAAAAPPAGYLAGRYGPGRVLAGGLAVTAVGAILLAQPQPQWHLLQLCLRVALIGIGNGLAAGPASVAALSLAPRSLVGSVGSASSFAKNIGFTLGPASVAMIWGSLGYSSGGLTAGFIVAAAFALVGAIAALRTRVLGRGAQDSDTEPT